MPAIGRGAVSIKKAPRRCQGGHSLLDYVERSALPESQVKLVVRPNSDRIDALPDIDRKTTSTTGSKAVGHSLGAEVVEVVFREKGPVCIPEDSRRPFEAAADGPAAPILLLAQGIREQVFVARKGPA